MRRADFAYSILAGMAQAFVVLRGLLTVLTESRQDITGHMLQLRVHTLLVANAEALLVAWTLYVGCLLRAVLRHYNRPEETSTSGM